MRTPRVAQAPHTVSPLNRTAERADGATTARLNLAFRDQAGRDHLTRTDGQEGTHQPGPPPGARRYRAAERGEPTIQ
jgi:hypothetical protein